MMQSLLYLRLDLQAPTTYTVPLLETLKQEITDLTIFEFDNFSAAHIRKYGLDLANQSNRLALVVAVSHADAPLTGLTSFFNQLLKVKPESLLLVLQGEQPTLNKMMQALAKNTKGPGLYQNLSATALQEVLKQYFS